MKKIMIAAASSGSGKTTICLAIIRILMDLGIDLSCFKCGPDYIDPMFHEKVLGKKSINLDTVFTDETIIKHLIHEHASDFSVIEGVMGFYDGTGNDMMQGSAYTLSNVTNTPVILIVDAKGMGRSIGAVVKGFLSYREPNNIAGIIFNRLPASMVNIAKEVCKECNTTFIGYIPTIKNVEIPSRHLGLYQADEIADLQSMVRLLADKAKETIDIDKIISIAESYDNFADFEGISIDKVTDKEPVIAVAKDEAFSFYYEDNIELLKKLGAKITYFSPIHDSKVPENISAIYMGGGYPELYMKELSDNTSMIYSIKKLIDKNIPIVAECGAFLYLHDYMRDDNGTTYKMVGAISGTAYGTGKLQRFGYVRLVADTDSLLFAKGDEMITHEFHYWDTDNNGSDLSVTKLSNGIEYKAAICTDAMYAGFPHLYFYNNINAISRFVRKAAEYRNE